MTITRSDGKEQVIDSGTVRRLSPEERGDMVKGVESDYGELFKGLKPKKKKPTRLIG